VLFIHNLHTTPINLQNFLIVHIFLIFDMKKIDCLCWFIRLLVNYWL